MPFWPPTLAGTLISTQQALCSRVAERALCHPSTRLTGGFFCPQMLY